MVADLMSNKVQVDAPAVPGLNWGQTVGSVRDELGADLVTMM
jgi:hypothetical protein